jgi:hypothetical protein
MIVITPTTGSQTIKFVMHDFTTNPLILLFRDTAKNKNLLVIEGTSVVSKNSYYNELTANFTSAPIEGRTYEMLIALASDNIVFHKETLFCTAQTVEDYTINNGVYNMKNDYAADADNEFAYYE